METSPSLNSTPCTFRGERLSPNHFTACKGFGSDVMHLTADLKPKQKVCCCPNPPELHSLQQGTSAQPSDAEYWKLSCYWTLQRAPAAGPLALIPMMESSELLDVVTVTHHHRLWTAIGCSRFPAGPLRGQIPLLRVSGILRSLHMPPSSSRLTLPYSCHAFCVCVCVCPPR